MVKLTTSVKVGCLSLTSTKLNNNYGNNLFSRFKPKTIIYYSFVRKVAYIIANATYRKIKIHLNSWYKT